MAVVCMFAIVLLVCLVNAVVALVCSLFTKKTSIALLSTYTTLLILYVVPPAIVALMQILDFPPQKIAVAQWSGITSPFSALFSIPLDENLNRSLDGPANEGNIPIVIGYFVFSLLLIAVSSIAMFVRLRSRRGLSE